MADQEEASKRAQSVLAASPPSSAGTDDIAEALDRFQAQQELADPDEGLPLADRLINRAVEAVGVVCLAAIFVIIFVSTLGRYAFNSPLIWGEEVVLGIIPWLVATGMFLSVRRRRLVTVQFMASKFRPKVARSVSIFSQLLSIFVFSYIAVAAYKYIGFFGRDPTPYLGLPKGLSTSAYLFCGAATAVAFAVGLLRSRFAGDPSTGGH